ncbi:MAG: hypothetical protein H0T15_01565 [Thermoleophilaceae bacterium]|nr:hypothetical protein [Thermoleophilaceae bacterium]
MSYFQAVRLYSAVECAIFATLVAVAIGGGPEGLKTALGWTHGFGWILLCLLVASGASRGIFPWPLLAATVSPVGPVGSSIGLEILARRRETVT